MIVLDMESRSRCNLKTSNGYIYADDPSTRVLCMAAADLDNKIVYAWLSERYPEERPLFFPGLSVGDMSALLDRGLKPLLEWLSNFELRVSYGGFPHGLAQAARDERPFLAYNADSFEAPMWDAVMSGRLPVEWYDIVPRLRRLNLTVNNYQLSNVCNALFGFGKDQGQRMIELLCIPKPDGTFTEPTTDTAHALLQYCLGDVAREAMLVKLFDLQPAAGPEDAVAQLNQQINARGFYFDKKLAQAAIRFWAAIRASQLDIARQRLGLAEDDITADAKFTRWLASRGIYTPSFAEVCLKGLIAHPDTPDEVRTACMLRLELARSGPTKLEKALDKQSSDGRVRGQFVYYGAHTGRWSGRDMQPHNLANPPELPVGIPEAAERVRKLDGSIVAEVIEAGGRPSDLLSAIVRPCIMAPKGKTLLIADFAGIEARGVAWLAEDADDLQVYKDGRDPYLRMASELFGIPEKKMSKETHAKQRKVGKIVVLACGYGQGPLTFLTYAAGAGVDLAESGLTPADCINAWREMHPLVAGTKIEGQRAGESEHGVIWRKGGLWKIYQKAMTSLANGEKTNVTTGTIRWRAEQETDGSRTGYCTLPSGRELIYRNLRMELMPSKWDGTDQPQIMYGVERTLYGGKLLENVCQAMCRDIMAESMIRLAKSGYDIVAHIHDEIVCETQIAGGLTGMVNIMAEPPAWASGFPVGVEGFAADRFQKEAPEGAPVFKVERVG